MIHFWDYFWFKICLKILFVQSPVITINVVTNKLNYHFAVRGLWQSM